VAGVPSQDSNGDPPKYGARTSPLCQHARCNWIINIRYLNIILKRSSRSEVCGWDGVGGIATGDRLDDQEVRFHTLHFTVTHTLLPLVFTGRILVTDFNTVCLRPCHLAYISLLNSIHLLSSPYSGRLESRNSTSLPFLLNHLRLPSQETPSVLILSCLTSSWRLQQKTPFPNNSVVIDICLPRRCIETVVLLLPSTCSFLGESVYRVVA
jgi:hypothetical protein